MIYLDQVLVGDIGRRKNNRQGAWARAGLQNQLRDRVQIPHCLPNLPVMMGNGTFNC